VSPNSSKKSGKTTAAHESKLGERVGIKASIEKWRKTFQQQIWLVVSTPLKNISQLGFFPIYGKIKTIFQTTNQKCTRADIMGKMMNQPIRRTPQNLKYCCANQVPPQLAISHDGSRSHTPQVSSHNLLVQLTNVTHTQSLGAQKYTRSNSKTRYTSSEFSGDLQPPPQPDVKYATETSRWESMCRSHDRVMTTCHTGAEIGW
jgi:hypothetical protein